MAAAQTSTGLSQADLDAMCEEAPEGDEDMSVRKKRTRNGRRITLSAMGREIEGLANGEPEAEDDFDATKAWPGLPQSELDGLCVDSAPDLERDASPMASRLQKAKRRRDSTGAGVEAMMALAAAQLPLASEDAHAELGAGTGGLSQGELDAMCGEARDREAEDREQSPERDASHALRTRRQRAFAPGAFVEAAPSPSPSRRRRPLRRGSSENLEPSASKVSMDKPGPDKAELGGPQRSPFFPGPLSPRNAA